MTDLEVVEEVAAIRDRLAALAADPERPDVAEELGALRAQLRRLALANETIGRRLAEQLDLPPTCGN